ncbi:hypothetical protein PG985_003573 [Apiospora marii]|uniref:Uncharacterized protein n=1 Tax=Apiospora marii TaxID=335849 RepID=A0ABR1SHP1_9PEZI
MSRALLAGSLLWATLVAAATKPTNFDECRRVAEDRRNNRTLPEWAVWNGTLRNFQGPEDQRPLALTTDGCKYYCGTEPQYSDVIASFQILTTWILPAIALMSQFPYESLSHKKWRNAEAFANWIGAPAAAITTTFWNIMTIHHCASKPALFKNQNESDCVKNALYILSCVNQYEYPRRRSKAEQDQRRDTALLRGVLWPYVLDTELIEARRGKLENLNENLAFQLRLQRRKGVYPVYISIIWFGMSFAFSIVIAFAALGDNLTAHSLALGLLLLWVPIVVFASVVDRNPTSATRCGDLIERWLFNIDQLFVPLPQPRENTPPHWRARRGNTQNANADDTEEFSIGEFLGQGRRLRYCGVTDTVLSYIAHPDRAHMPLPNLFRNPGTKPMLTHQDFQRDLVSRPWKWYFIWGVAQVIVSMGFTMAFMVSFNTPTVGLGCRSLSYLVWWCCTVPSWVLLGLQQEPRPWIRHLLVVPNLLAILTLFATMIALSISGFDDCVCKSSTFGAGGGYMDFQNGRFYKDYYDVSTYWGAATGVGGSTLVLSIVWLAWKWHKSSSLWKVTENTSMRPHDDLPLDWLT